MPKVSVIVPIYGVEKYIERCARSLFEQTLDDMEFIFVNDCTKDRSMEVLDRVIGEYPCRKSQIKIYNLPQNAGLHNVRKEGLRLSTGEFVAHCDSDDWVEAKMYELLYNKAIEQNADFVKCQYYKSDGIVHHKVRLVADCNDKELILREMISVKGWNCIWDKLAKRELYDGIEYPVTSMWEDFVISIQLLIKSRKFAVVDKALYYYYDNPNSICTNGSEEANIKRCQNAQKNLDLIVKILDREFPINKFENELILLKYAAKRWLIPAMSKYKNYKFWKITYPEIDKPIILNYLLPLVLWEQYLLVVLRVYPIYKYITHDRSNSK